MVSVTYLLSSATGALLDAALARFSQPSVWPDLESAFACYLLTTSDLALPSAFLASARSVDATMLRRTPELATFGYLISSRDCGQGFKDAWVQGYSRLFGREVIPNDRHSFLFNPIELLGITVGAACCEGVSTDGREWLLGHIERAFTSKLFVGASAELMALCAARTLGAEIRSGWPVSQFPGQPDALDTADLLTVAAISASLPNIFAAAALPNAIDAEGIEQELVGRVLSASVQIRDRADAVALYIALMKAVERSLTNPSLIDEPEAKIAALCRRFQLFADPLTKRQRNRPSFKITDEYDVQDLLHAILRLHFDDVRPEVWTPSYAASSSRVDFFLPREKTVVEAKMTRHNLGQKDVADQLIIDKERYSKMQQVESLVCFVYDPERRCHNPSALESDLQESGDRGRLRVSVVVCPRGL